MTIKRAALSIFNYRSFKKLFEFISRMQENLSPVAMIIISIALMLFGGFLMTRVTKLLKLPNVTAYIITGILLGPFCFKLIPKTVIDGMDFISDIALAFIAFNTGEFFKLSDLKKNGMKVVIITVFESLLASFLVFGLCYFILRLNLAFSIVLGALVKLRARNMIGLEVHDHKLAVLFKEAVHHALQQNGIVRIK